MNNKQLILAVSLVAIIILLLAYSLYPFTLIVMRGCTDATDIADFIPASQGEFAWIAQKFTATESKVLNFARLKIIRPAGTSALQFTAGISHILTTNWAEMIDHGTGTYSGTPMMPTIVSLPDGVPVTNGQDYYLIVMYDADWNFYYNEEGTCHGIAFYRDTTPQWAWLLGYQTQWWYQVGYEQLDTYAGVQNINAPETWSNPGNINVQITLENHGEENTDYLYARILDSDQMGPYASDYGWVRTSTELSPDEQETVTVSINVPGAGGSQSNFYGVAQGGHLDGDIYVIDDSDTFTVNYIDNQKPTAYIDQPNDGTALANPIHVEAHGTSNAGGIIELIDIYVDGGISKSESGSSITTDLVMTNGTHEIGCQVFCSVGGYSEMTTIDVTVSGGSVPYCGDGNCDPGEAEAGCSDCTSGTYTVLITTIPTYCSVTMNGQTFNSGDTGAVFENLQGGPQGASYVCTVTYPQGGYQAKTETIIIHDSINPGTVNIRLVPNGVGTYTLTVKTAPKNCKVLLEGIEKDSGTDGAVFENLVGGTYDYKVMKDGYATKTGEVTVDASMEIEETLELKYSNIPYRYIIPLIIFFVPLIISASPKIKGGNKTRIVLIIIGTFSAIVTYLYLAGYLLTV